LLVNVNAVKTRDENVSVSFRIARLAFSSLSRETRRSRMRDFRREKGYVLVPPATMSACEIVGFSRERLVKAMLVSS